MREYSELFVGFLSGYAFGDKGHNNVFGCHEGDFGHEAAVDDGGVDDEAVGDVVEDDEEGVGEEGLFGDVGAADGGVVERSFELVVC